MPDADAGQTRTAVRQLLELLADSEAQRAYERDVPIADVPAELRCMWFDDLYHPTSAFFSEAFSSDELVVLAGFNQFYQSRLETLPTASGVDGLQRSKEWGEIIDEADATLVQLGWSTGE